MSKAFDVHFEIGDDPLAPGMYYAKVVLGNNAVKFEHTALSVSSAIFAVAMDMEASGMWGIIMQNPGMSVYPQLGPGGRANQTSGAGPTTTVTTTPAKKPDPNVVRQRAVDLTAIPIGECEAICISFDNFGKAKCASICPTKGKPKGALTPAQRK